MEHLMHSCWVGFAKTGAPQCDNQAWPMYTPQNDQLLEFGPNTAVVAGFRKAQYSALESVVLPGH
jgi:para-nitrobenzyl esterase